MIYLNLRYCCVYYGDYFKFANCCFIRYYTHPNYYYIIIIEKNLSTYLLIFKFPFLVIKVIKNIIIIVIIIIFIIKVITNKVTIIIRISNFILSIFMKIIAVIIRFIIIAISILNSMNFWKYYYGLFDYCLCFN